jgi:type II secretory pathway pseudopilin PulG
MVIVAISMPVLLGCGTLAIDLSSFFKAQKQAQSAAYDLPTNPTLALSDGGLIATTNDPTGTAQVSTNYAGSPNKVKVTVTRNSPSFFGRVFGVTSAKISASAVAGGQGTVAQAAIFAYNNGSGCGTGIDLGTNGLNIQGGIESNGSLNVSSNSQSIFGTGTYGTGGSYTLNGAVFAPKAEILVSGNSSGTGFLEGNTVVFGGSNSGGSGNGFAITGDGPPVASNGYALLQ